MFEHFALAATWDDMPTKLLDRYNTTASRVVMYLGEHQIRNDERARQMGRARTERQGL